MADIVLTCPQCQKNTAVSEYVSGQDVPCPACGALMPLPVKKSKSSFSLRRREPPTPEPAPGKSFPDAPPVPRKPAIDDRHHSAFLKRDIWRVKRDKWVQRTSWLVFLGLGGWLYHLRFNDGWMALGLTLPELQQYGLLALGLVYILIIVCALRDNMFAGLLAVTVPLYPFYYIFMISGALFIRALAAALLVGFGYDLVILLQEWMTNMSTIVNTWIRSA